MMALRHKLLVALFGLAVSLITGCASLETETDAQLDKTIEMLLEAIRARDDGAILALAANPQTFSEGGRLKNDVAGFLYDGGHIRSYNPDARSVVEIMALGPLRVHIERERGSRATVLFIPEKFEAKAQVVSFYSERWMHDYFACEFHLIGGRWVLLYNICFAESDGPYPKPYGIRQAPGRAIQELGYLDPVTVIP